MGSARYNTSRPCLPPRSLNCHASCATWGPSCTRPHRAHATRLVDRLEALVGEVHDADIGAPGSQTLQPQGAILVGGIHDVQDLGPFTTELFNCWKPSSTMGSTVYTTSTAKTSCDCPASPSASTQEVPLGDRAASGVSAWVTSRSAGGCATAAPVLATALATDHCHRRTDLRSRLPLTCPGCPSPFARRRQR